MKYFLSVLVLLGMTGVSAEDTQVNFLYDGSANALLVDKNTFFVSVTDEVTGGCLPKPAQLKETMEKALKNHGFKIAKDRENPFTPEVNISTLGFRVNGMCAVEMNVNMYFPVQVVVPKASDVPTGNKTYATYTYSIGAYIANYRRSQMQKQLNKISRKFSDRIYMYISKAKDDIFPKFPSIERKVKATISEK